uniref:Putative Actin-binding LIM protein 1 n=1 Tax=Davidia involucrata TaxID=16924 RepID=A0A5B6ZI53_DAVIN
MEGEAGDFQDWEVLHNSDDTGLVNSSDSDENMRGLEGIEGDSEGMIRNDYFSLDSHKRYAKTVAEGDVSEEGSAESDNPSWIDPASDTRYPRKESGEFWSDSSSDRSDDRKFSEFEPNNELGFAENEKIQVGFEGIGEIGADSERSGKFWSDSGGIGPISMKFGDFEKDSEMGIGDYAKSQEGSEILDEGKVEEGDGHSRDNEDVAIEATKLGGEEEKRSVVWWKLPLELLKYCAFRVNPVWTFSVAAAVMGLIILGRRLSKMKRKSRGLQLKVTLDDKKVSQFMSRAARLNEAFSVVKRVPIIRPSLPAAGLTPWPVMSLR